MVLMLFSYMAFFSFAYLTLEYRLGPGFGDLQHRKNRPIWLQKVIAGDPCQSV